MEGREGGRKEARKAGGRKTGRAGRQEG